MQETQNLENAPGQPGAVIAPSPTSGQSTVTAPAPVISVDEKVQTVTQPAEPAIIPGAQNNQQFTSESSQSEGSFNVQPQPDTDGDSVSWTASEYVGHHKTTGWYASFAAVAAVVIGFVFIVTRSFSSVVALTVGAALMAVYAGRPPRDKLYQLDKQGFMVGQKEYDFAQFRSFSTIHEGNLGSILFSPLKRFSPPMTIYFPLEMEAGILVFVEKALPFEEYKHDLIDRLMRQIRF